MCPKRNGKFQIPSVAEQLVSSKKKCGPRSLLVFHIL